MFNIFATGKSGMNAYQNKLDYLANDLVNINTTGYKKSDVGFKDLLTESLDRKGNPLANKNAVNGTGVKTGVDYYVNDKQGNLLPTGQNTDLAIDGKGYFAIQRSDGSIVYTRDGNFHIDANGTLVTSLGDKVYIDYTNGASEGAPALNGQDMSVTPNGEIFIMYDDQSVQIGTIPVFTAIGDKSFVSIGNNYCTLSEGAQVTQSNDFDIRQGYLEGSNVDTSEAMTEIILAQKAFQLSSKAVRTADDIWGMINSMS